MSADSADSTFTVTGHRCGELLSGFELLFTPYTQNVNGYCWTQVWSVNINSHFILHLTRCRIRTFAFYILGSVLPKFGQRLARGFSSAAGVKSACQLYGTMTLGSSLRLCTIRFPESRQYMLVICIRNRVLGPGSEIHYPVPNTGNWYPFCTDYR